LGAPAAAFGVTGQAGAATTPWLAKTKIDTPANAWTQFLDILQRSLLEEIMVKFWV
jgi:hypothetical protein